MNRASIGLRNVLSKFGNIKKHAGFVFWIILLATFILEFFVVMNSINIILESRRQPEVVKKAPQVRINFTDYNYVIERMEKAKTFQNSVRVNQNPFGQR